MADLASGRERIQGRLFDGIGSNVTHEAFSSETTDKWGDATPSYAAGAIIKAIPYDYLSYNEQIKLFGEVSDTSVYMAFPYDSSVAQKDRITFDGDTFEVVEVRKPGFGDSSSAYGALVLIAKLNPFLD